MKRTLFSSKIDKKTRRLINKINYLSIKRYRRGMNFEDSYIPSGAYSVYFRRGRIGIKVLRTCFRGRGLGGYKSPERAMKSPMWIEALEEFAALRIADCTGHTPIPYCVKAIQLGKKFYPAIFMEHIKGPALGDFIHDCEMGSREEDHLYQHLNEMEGLLETKCGVDHSYDSGGNNAIVVKHSGRRVQIIKLIDFSPGLLRISRDTLEEALENIPELWGYNLFGWKYSSKGIEYMGREERVEF